MAPILKSTKARDHHIFAGKLDRSALLISGLGQLHDCGGGMICGIRLRRRPTYAFSVEPPDGSIEDRGERNPRQVGEEQHGSQTA